MRKMSRMAPPPPVYTHHPNVLSRFTFRCYSCLTHASLLTFVSFKEPLIHSLIFMP